MSQHTDNAIGSFLEDPACLPHLTSLDISGHWFVPLSSFKVFYNLRPGIQFLGLVSPLCKADFLSSKNHVDFRQGIKVRKTRHFIVLLCAFNFFLSFCGTCIKLLQMLFCRFASIVRVFFPVISSRIFGIFWNMYNVQCTYYTLEVTRNFGVVVAFWRTSNIETDLFVFSSTF